MHHDLRLSIRSLALKQKHGPGTAAYRFTSLIKLLLALVVSFTAYSGPGAAFDQNDSREERAAQTIYNALYMSRDAGEPSQAVIDGYRRAKPVGAAVGTGYRGLGNPTDEDGWGMAVNYDVIFPNQDGAAQIRSDYSQYFAYDGTDSRTGAEIHLSGRYVHILYYADDVVLRMQWGTARTNEEPQEEIRRALKLWHFFHAEAVRLGLLEELDPPSLTVRVWDELEGEWLRLTDAQVYSRLPAHLDEAEAMTLELSANSQALQGDEPYDIDLMLGIGAEEVRLYDLATGEELFDNDNDGWLDVTVEPVEGEHQPRQIVVEFRAMDDDAEETTQRTALFARFRDETGEASSGNLLERVTPVIVIDKLVMRAQNPSYTLTLFSSKERVAFQRRFDSPGNPDDAEGLLDWVNGVFDPLSDAKNNWTGLEGGDGAPDTVGLRDFVRLVPEQADARSQASAISRETGDGTVYMGWHRGNRTGIQFFTIEDRPGEPLTVGPLFEHHNARFEVEIAILADVTAQFDPTDPNGYGPPLNPQEVQRELYEDILGVERLFAGIYQVDPLDEFRDGRGEVREIGAQDFPAIKRALRRPTRDLVQEVANSTSADSEFLDTYFGARDRVDVPNLAIDFNNYAIEPGVYELQFDLRLWEKADRERKYRVDAAIRFWVWDLDGFAEITRVQTDFTGRQGSGKKTSE